MVETGSSVTCCRVVHQTIYSNYRKQYNYMLVLHPTQGAWIEINRMDENEYKCLLHPTQGAWIEIMQMRHIS